MVNCLTVFCDCLEHVVLANPDQFRQQVAVATDIPMLIELGKRIFYYLSIEL